MSSALGLERPLKIAYLGPQATFTHMAALKRFGRQVEYLPCEVKANVKIGEVINSTLVVLNHEAKQNNIVIHCQIPNDLPPLATDEGDMKEVFLICSIMPSRQCPPVGRYLLMPITCIITMQFRLPLPIQDRVYHRNHSKNIRAILYNQANRDRAGSLYCKEETGRHGRYHSCRE